MPDKPEKRLYLSSSPHIYSPVSVSSLMLSVVLALIPSTIYGIYLYGIFALASVLVSVAVAVIGEYLFRKIIKASMTITDGSAIVTGMLVALIVPPKTPLWMVALGSLFAIIVVKEFFGGLGSNPFNPALAARAFLLMSFPAAMTTWTMPKGLAVHADALTSASKLADATAAATSQVADATSAATPLGLLHGHYTVAQIAQYYGASDTAGFYKQLFLGFRPGSMGESSILLILLGGLLLLSLGVIQWIIPVSVIGSTFVFAWIFGLDPVFTILTGGVVFSAFFMATDYVTRPLTPLGQVLYGVGIGLIIVVIREFGGYPEGVTYAILIMNIITPYLNKLKTKKYGYVAPPKPVKAVKGASK